MIALEPVLIVDDDPSVRLRLRRLLARLGVEAGSVDQAGGVAEAEAACGDRVPKLALVDIGLPDGDGLDLVAWMRAAHPSITPIVMSSFGSEELILAAVQCGALGYLLKERDDEELFVSLRSIARGGAPIDPFVARHILRRLGPPPRTAGGAGVLTGRETEILAWVAQGLISRDIARRLDRSPQTIESHIKSIFRKLGVSTRTEAVGRARERGLLS